MTARLAVLDGLLRPTGAVPNGGTMRAPRPPVRPRPLAFLPVVVTRAGVGGWACDSCPATGYGWPSMDAHAAATGHRTFTAQ